MTQEQEKDPTAEQPEGGSEETQNDEKIDVSKYQDQIKNLEKGIYSSREEAKAAKSQVENLQKQLDEFKGKVEFEASEEEVTLHPDDQKRLEAWARKQGLVTKAELEAEKQKITAESQKSMASTAIDELLAKHPELDSNDNWAKVQAEFQLYKTPTSLAEYRRVFDRIAKDLKGSVNDEDAEARAKAKQANKSRLSLGGGSQSQSNDVAVEDLQKKYPNLSKDQIEARVAEINAIYKDKK